jgi:hypothetical protein
MKGTIGVCESIKLWHMTTLIAINCTGRRNVPSPTRFYYWKKPRGAIIIAYKHTWTIRQWNN